MPFPDVSQRAEFLQQAGWSVSVFDPVGEDWSVRKFYRLRRADGLSAILIESYPDSDPLAPNGHKLGDFSRIAVQLRQSGVSVPEIYALDVDAGFLLMEDFGSTSFRDVLDRRLMNTVDLYRLATDALIEIRHNGGGFSGLPEYFDSYVHKGRQRIVDWYMPIALHRKNDDGLVGDYLSVWDGIMQSLPAPVYGFQHIDFHLQNLLWLPSRAGVAQCGMIDFQGGMHGPVPYDLTNLLDDIRVDVAEDIRAECLQRFLNGLDAAARESVLLWYDVLAAQFHCRIIGQVYKLALTTGKTRLLQYMPIVTRHLARGLEKPVLKPLKLWLQGQGVGMLEIPDFDADSAKSFILPDAY